MFNWSISSHVNKSVLFSSHDYAPQYHFIDTGLFDITLSYYTQSDTFVMTKEIHVKDPFILDLGRDTILCFGISIRLDAGVGQHCYQWQDYSNGSTYLVDTTGLYHVKVVTQNFCIYHDSIEVQFENIPQKPTLTKRNDTLYTDSGYQYIWYLNGVLIPGGTYYMKPEEIGFYQVLITNEFGCSSLSDSFSIEGLSVKLRYNPTFNIYPNPSLLGSEIQIESESLIHSIKITDLTGRTVYQKKDLNQNQLTLKLSKRGVYIFTINGSNHYRVFTK